MHNIANVQSALSVVTDIAAYNISYRKLIATVPLIDVSYSFEMEDKNTQPPYHYLIS
jgi:hypothetical protein